MPGTLFLCGTPIGNLEDITLRAVRVLREADVIAAEDTRVTRRLLSHYDIHPGELLSYREDNEATMGPHLVGRLAQGARVVVVTDAGMPGISDPGSALADRARLAGIPVEIVPGPSAVLAGLLASGLGGGRFVFEGFLPRGGTERTARLQALEREERPTVLFESPHRVLATLRDLEKHLGGDRPLSVSRELTKKFEETRMEPIAALRRHFEAHEPRGEFVLVVPPAPPPAATFDAEALEQFLRTCLADEVGAREASEAAARRFGVPRKVAYQAYLKLTR